MAHMTWRTSASRGGRPFVARSSSTTACSGEAGRGRERRVRGFLEKGVIMLAAGKSPTSDSPTVGYSPCDSGYFMDSPRGNHRRPEATRWHYSTRNVREQPHFGEW